VVEPGEPTILGPFAPRVIRAEELLSSHIDQDLDYLRSTGLHLEALEARDGRRRPSGQWFDPDRSLWPYAQCNERGGSIQTGTHISCSIPRDARLGSTLRAASSQNRP
jgi:hypothetical protein